MDTECTRSVANVLAGSVITGSVVFIFLFAVVWILDWWKYAPYPQKLRCKMYGHNYHDGMAQNLIRLVNGETIYYDFCQRCHTMQNERQKDNIEMNPTIFEGKVL